jgi:hypothetical protein
MLDVNTDKLLQTENENDRPDFWSERAPTETRQQLSDNNLRTESNTYLVTSPKVGSTPQHTD